MAPLIFVAVVGSVLGILATSTLSQLSNSNSQALARQNEIGGFYNSDILAWHNLEREYAGLTLPTGTAVGSKVEVNFEHHYSSPPGSNPYHPEQYEDGKPISLAGTKNLDPQKSTSSRSVASTDYINAVDMTATTPNFCGFTGYAGDKANYSSCLISVLSDPVTPVLVPTADLKANGSDVDITIANGATATITWTATNVSSCRVVPTAWTGLTGSQVTPALTDNITYSLVCDSTLGQVTDSVTVRVTAPVLLVDPLTYCTNAIHNQTCPAGYAVVGWTDPAGQGQHAWGPKIGSISYCCRMPTGMLMNDHAYDPENCGPNRVATGAVIVGGGENHLRCTLINTGAGWSLGTVHNGNWYTAPGCQCYSGQGNALRVSRTALPPAVRFAAARNSVTRTAANNYVATFDESACIPYLASQNVLMTSKPSKYCGSQGQGPMSGKQVLLNGNPVNLFPSCTVGSITGAWLNGRTYQETYTNFVCN